MCGLAGLINIKIPVNERDQREIQHLLMTQKHRGPDSEGIKQLGDKILLGSVRLRITDAQNADADMPMQSPCGNYTLIYNGEIYNHISLREELTDYPFRTRSDTETLLASYMKWGAACLEKFEGMFAFCIFDHKKGEVFFAVDPSGQKFLYYLQDQSSFVFASEITALITDPYRIKNWDQEGLKEYLAQRMILGRDTHIREIKKMEPGTYGILNETGSFTIHRYYTVPIGAQDRQDLILITQEISESVRKGCEETFNLEVPYGHLLSGGIDSSIVTQHAKENGLDLSTYSIGFAPFEGDAFGIPSTFNEFDYSRFISNHLGTNHREITLAPDDYCDLIDTWIGMMGEPLDSSEAPMLVKLFETASENHTVIFCGSGPDEAFDGYGLGRALRDVSPKEISAAYYDRFNWVFSTDLGRLIPGHADIRENVIAKMDGFLAPYRTDVTDPLQLAQLINLHGRMAAYEFRQMDVISMHYSVEARSPLADRRLTRAAFNCAPALKQHQNIDKWIYKESLRGQLPDRIIDRRKEGFPTPIEFWFSSAFAERIKDMQSPSSPLFSLGILDENYAAELWAMRDPAYRALDYRLYCLNSLLKNQTPFIGTSIQN